MASPVFASGLVVIGFKERHVCALFASAKCGRERETTTMASPYQGTSYPGNESQGNVTSLTQSGQAAATAPEIRTIGLSDLHRALRLGWEDFKAVPSHAIILCAIYPVLGLVLARLVQGYAVLPLLFPLAAGFALLGPFAALGLYEMRRTWPSTLRVGRHGSVSFAVVRRDARARHAVIRAVRDLDRDRASDLCRSLRL
jgi:uncharacterized membrane protein